MPLQLTRQQQLLREYAQGAPGTERPYGPETASVASEGKKEKRRFRQSPLLESFTWLGGKGAS